MIHCVYGIGYASQNVYLKDNFHFLWGTKALDIESCQNNNCNWCWQTATTKCRLRQFKIGLYGSVLFVSVLFNELQITNGTDLILNLLTNKLCISYQTKWHNFWWENWSVLLATTYKHGFNTIIIFIQENTKTEIFKPTCPLHLGQFRYLET
jgi:hypothetical protein